MNTLREIGDFTGTSPHTSMHAVGDLVPLLSGNQRTSMRAMIQGLQQLPPIGLQVEPVGNRYGDVPFAPVFRVHPSSGVVMETRFILYQNGPQPQMTAVVGNSGVFGPITITYPGIYFFQVTRTGITNTGVTVLDQKFHVEGVQPPAPPPPPPVPPLIAVKSNGDGSFVVSGSGFLANAPVSIRVADANLNNLFFTDTSSPDGKLAGFPTGKICQVRGASITFSAQDGRINPANHQAIVSNYVTTTCPF
jgi:hypothetical protein